MAVGKWPTYGWFCMLYYKYDESTAVFHKKILVGVCKRGWKLEGQLDQREGNFSPTVDSHL